MHDMDKGTTYLFQTHYVFEILRTYNLWNANLRLTPMQLNTRLNKGVGDKNPALDFHCRYRSIVDSLGYLVTMICPDLTWTYSEHSKYLQFPEKNLMLAGEHVLSYLRSTWNRIICYSRDSHENLARFVGLGGCELGQRY